MIYFLIRDTATGKAGDELKISEDYDYYYYVAHNGSVDIDSDAVATINVDTVTWHDGLVQKSAPLHYLLAKGIQNV